MGGRMKSLSRAGCARFWRPASLWLFLLVSIFSVNGASRILYVNQQSLPGGDGASWGSAYTELRDALTNSMVGTGTAGDPVHIWVVKGTYKPTGETNREAAFVLKDHVW